MPGTSPTSRATAARVSFAGPTRPITAAAARKISLSSIPRRSPAIAPLSAQHPDRERAVGRSAEQCVASGVSCPEEQEKLIKFNTLPADLVVFHNALDISDVRPLVAEGWNITTDQLGQIPHLRASIDTVVLSDR
ncbi:hypothetical protein [Nonomuraea helvata]|uniref:Uncharacterized protein n=1 Tax=Nonomuraea helvata TaxID=37484 RepID=A0ABV5S3B9_9ACTN